MIRTPDLLVPNQALYQTEPHPDYLIFHALRALPVVTKPLSSSQQRLANRQVTATPFCSLHPPPAALANVPKLSQTQIIAAITTAPVYYITIAAICQPLLLSFFGVSPYCFNKACTRIYRISKKLLAGARRYDDYVASLSLDIHYRGIDKYRLYRICIILGYVLWKSYRHTVGLILKVKNDRKSVMSCYLSIFHFVF